MTENYFRNKTAIVTGASSGIGREIARELLKNAAHVVVTARRGERLTQLSEECRNYEGKCIPIRADLTNATMHAQISVVAQSINGCIDLLINNASVGSNTPVLSADPTMTRKIIETNLIGTIGLTQEIVRSMVQNQTGQVVFVTSLAGKMGFPGLSAYSASKFGVEGFAEALRSEVVDDGIAVTVFRPGVTDTEFFDVAGMEEFASEKRQQGKMHSPASAARYLVNNLSRKPDELTFGRDRLFIQMLPFIPFPWRLKILSLIG